MGTRPYDVTTEASTSRRFDLGYTFKDPETGFVYQYVKIHASSANAASVGRCFFNTVADEFIVSDDLTSGMAPADFAGVAVGTIAKGSYGFLLIDGDYDDVLKITGAVTAGVLLGPGTTDGTCTTFVAQTAGDILKSVAFAVALETVTAGILTIAARIKKFMAA